MTDEATDPWPAWAHIEDLYTLESPTDVKTRRPVLVFETEAERDQARKGLQALAELNDAEISIGHSKRVLAELDTYLFSPPGGSAEDVILSVLGRSE